MPNKIILKSDLTQKYRFIDDKNIELNYTLVGVDEAGRGCLAGPVVASAVVLPRGVVIEGADDSKKLSAKKRESLSEIIKEKATAFAFGYVDAGEIDETNILGATMKAMTSAVEQVGHVAGNLFVLIDGNSPPDLIYPYECIIGGDSVYHVISVASILAKVERDAHMVRISGEYPEYGFASHKGYGTAAHRAAIKKYGPCPIHRMTFNHG